jgi:HEAT repeat protein
VQASSVNWRFRSTRPGRARLFLILALSLIIPANALADGCFVLPKFVWEKQRDINEPTQKAIILHDAGREDLILQVKYEGPAEEFGWLIPVPNLPKVQKGSMDCFYELSRYTQKHLERRSLYEGHTEGGSEKPEPVTVIEMKTVGAYEVAVLATKDAGSLENWLKQHQFSFPEGKTDVIEFYVNQQWYFIAVKIQLNKGSGFQLSAGARRQTSDPSPGAIKQWQLQQGELQPLHISFDTDKCVFPLKISSINGSPSEVQVYVLSKTPLVEKSVLDRQIQDVKRQTAEQAKRSEALNRPLEEMRNLRPDQKAEREKYRAAFTAELKRAPQKTPFSTVGGSRWPLFGKVSWRELPKCAEQLERLQNSKWWITKQARTFSPEDMSDLEFEPAIPVFAEALAGESGGDAARNLIQFGFDAVPTLVAAIQSTNSNVKINAASVAEQIEDRRITELLGTMLKDSEARVRKEAAYALARLWNPKLTETFVELLLDQDGDVRQASWKTLLDHREDASKHIPVFQKMLQEENAAGQESALAMLGRLNVNIPRADLLRLFANTNSNAIGMTYTALQGGKPLQPNEISCEEVLLLLQNSNEKARWLGIGLMSLNRTKQSVEFTLPLLRDTVPRVQKGAHDVLRDLTGQGFPQSEPEKWEQWWADNKATFTPKEPAPQKP